MAGTGSGPTRTPTDYFNDLSRSYATSTGNTTATAFRHALSLPHISSRITPTSIVHDNACGVGTATHTLLSTIHDPPARIQGTDNNASMIAAFEHTIKAASWSNVHAQVMDSHALTFAEGTFDVSFTNISWTNFSDPKKAVAEVHRTLKTDGLGVVVQWKRFTVGEMVHAAQRIVKGPEAELMPVPGKEWMEEGAIVAAVQEAGFEQVKQDVVKFAVKGEELTNVRGFMTSPMTGQARKGWSDEELRQWEGAVDRAIAEEIRRPGDLIMEAWVVTGVKL